MFLTITKDSHLLIEGTSIQDAYELGRISEQLRAANIQHEANCPDSDISKPWLRLPIAPLGYNIPKANLESLSDGEDQETSDEN